MVYWVYLFSNTKLPPNPEGLHGVLGVSVLEHEALLDLLVDPLQLLEVGLELIDSLFVFTESAELLLQGSLHTHTNSGNSVHLSFYPGSDLVGLLGKGSSQSLVVLLLPQFVLESLVSLWHQGLDLIPLGLDILPSQVGVGVDGGAGNVVLLGEGFTLVDESDDGGELFVSLSQSGLELCVSINETVDLVQSVNNEHIDQ